MRRLSLPLALAVIVAALVFAFEGRWPWRRLETRTVPAVQAVAVEPAAVVETRDTLRRGETLGDLFGRQGLLRFDLVGLFERAGLDPRRLRAGLVVSFRRNPGDSLPSEAWVRAGPDLRLAVRRVSNDAWEAERRPIAWRSEVARVEGSITTSLYDAFDSAIPDSLLARGDRVRLAWELAEVYAWSVDFSRDIQPGDRFALLVERRISDEGEVRPGKLYAATLFNAGKQLNALRFETPDGVRYYDEDGNSLRRAFLRAPVEFRRISSNFSRRRYHPVLGVYRRHAGTDYSAPSGTPVMAAGDGVVVRAGFAGGYGRLVEIRHRNGIRTRYAHLRAFGRGIRAGARVTQSQVIGYVGASGLVTAAHLHYEFLVNGVPRDSRRIGLATLGNGEPIPGELRAVFIAERDRLFDALGTMPRPQLASVSADD